MYSTAICGFNGFSQIISSPFQQENNNILHDLSNLHCEAVSNPVVIDVGDGDKPSSTHNRVKDVVMSWNRIYVLMRDNTVVTTSSSLDNLSRNLVKYLGIRYVSCSWKNTFWITVNDRCHFCEQGNEFEQQDTGDDVVFEKHGDGVKCDQQIAGSKQKDVSLELEQHDTVADLKLDDINSVSKKSDEFLKKVCCIKANNCTNLALTTTGQVFSFELKNTRLAFCELVISDKLHVSSVSCGKHHTLLLADTGSVYSYGTGSHGELGHGTVDNERMPRPIDILNGVKVTAVAAGGWHSVALGSCGEIYVWGWNERGQLGMPCSFLRNTPSNVTDGGEENDVVNIQTLPQLLDICAPEDLSLTLQSDKRIDVNLLTITKVACGTRHTVVLTEDGLAFSWGWNEYGQLALGDTIDRDRPCVVKYFVSKRQRVFDVFAGHWNSAFVVKDESD